MVTYTIHSVMNPLIMESFLNSFILVLLRLLTCHILNVIIILGSISSLDYCTVLSNLAGRIWCKIATMIVMMIAMVVIMLAMVVIMPAMVAIMLAMVVIMLAMVVIMLAMVVTMMVMAIVTPSFVDSFCHWLVHCSIVKHVHLLHVWYHHYCRVIAIAGVWYHWPQVDCTGTRGLLCTRSHVYLS